MLHDPALHLAFASGELLGSALVTTTKTLADVGHIYADITGIDPETHAYHVQSFCRGPVEQTGNLYAGMTTLPPLGFHGELNMTRGHYHADRDQNEVYVGVTGEGLLLLGAPDESWWAEPVSPGSVHHISGNTAHRLVNTGSEDLTVFAVWPTVAGHDYDTITPATFGVRVYRDGAGYRLQEVAP
ncbi:MAG: glucose-6-phosphate isomerase family protein [Propioniciclava sp.]